MTVVGHHSFHSAASAAAVGATWGCSYLLSKAIAITTVGFSGRLTIQGSFDGDAWLNAVYVQQGELDNVEPGDSELGFVQDTGLRVYAVSEFWPFMRVNLTERSAGSVSVMGYGHEGGLPSPISRVDVVRIAELILAGKELYEFYTTGAAAIALSTSMAKNFRLLNVTVKLSAAPTSAGSITVTKNSRNGSTYDTLLDSLSAIGATDFVFSPSDDKGVCIAGTEIDVAYVNTDVRTYGVEILCEDY